MTKSNASPTASRPRRVESVQVALSKPEQASLRAHNERIAGIKLELANVVLQRAALELREQELCERVRSEAARYENEIRATARANGLDVDHPVALDPEKMTLAGRRA